MVVPSILSILLAFASAAAVNAGVIANRDQVQHGDGTPTPAVPGYFQTSYGPYAGMHACYP